MDKDDTVCKEVNEETSKKLEDFLDNLSKLTKYSLIPISLIISATVVKSQNLLGSFDGFYIFFVTFWAGLISALIFQTFKFKINAMNGSFIYKLFLKISLLTLLSSIFISGVLMSFNNLPESYINKYQKTESTK